MGIPPIYGVSRNRTLSANLVITGLINKEYHIVQSETVQQNNIRNDAGSNASFHTQTFASKLGNEKSYPETKPECLNWALVLFRIFKSVDVSSKFRQVGKVRHIHPYW